MSANVESSPPDKPTTAVLQPMCRRRVARPVACNVKMVSQRSESSAAPAGTNGVGEKKRCRAVSVSGMKNLVQTVVSGNGWNELERCRSAAIRCKSGSA